MVSLLYNHRSNLEQLRLFTSPPPSTFNAWWNRFEVSATFYVPPHQRQFLRRPSFSVAAVRESENDRLFHATCLTSVFRLCAAGFFDWKKCALHGTMKSRIGWTSGRDTMESVDTRINSPGNIARWVSSAGSDKSDKWNIGKMNSQAN